MAEIENLTPHTVVVLRDDAEGTVVGYTGVGPAAKESKFSVIAEYLPTGKVARASQKDEPVGQLEINGASVPLITTVFGEPTDLPAPKDGTMYIVSIITAQAATLGRPEINLWGNCSAGFPYHAIACGVSQRVRYFDPKVGSYIALPEVEPRGAGSQVLDWRVEERGNHSFIEFIIPRQVFDVKNLPLVIPPAVAQGKGVVVSGKGPWWLTGTITRTYARNNASWVAVFTPQESARCDSEGKKWSEKNPGFAPAVVISSSDSTVKVGMVIPFRLPDSK